MRQTGKLTGGKRERAISLITNHECGNEDSAAFEMLSLEDQKLVRAINREIVAEEKGDKQIFDSCTTQEHKCFVLTRCKS